MPGIRFLGVFTIVPTTILLTISFFVLFALRKVEQQGLKAFGYVIAVLLWISAALIFGVGLYTITTGQHPMMPMMQEMMKGSMMGQQQMMQRQMLNR
jgi:hypothetical protein